MKKKKILFYYPQHFNRTKEGTNPFFDALLRTCERNNIQYDILEEPDPGTDKPRNPNAKKGDLFFWTVTSLRKLFSLIFPKQDFFKREKKVAKMINSLTLGKFKYDNVISIAGALRFIFSALNPKGRVFEMQHGILYKHHKGFFDTSTLKLMPQYYASNIHFLMWGKGYKEIFEKGEENILKDRIHVIGYPAILHETKNKSITKNKNKITLSLQLTFDLTETQREEEKQLIREFLENIKDSNFEVIIRHHPRFNNCICIDDLLKEFPNARLTTGTIEDNSSESFLHVTISSTTAFEFAALGIPTYFISGANYPEEENVFKGEFNYPLYWGMSIEEVLDSLSIESNKERAKDIVKAWFSKFYSPFNEEEFIKSLVLE